MNIQTEYGLLVAVTLADISIDETFYYQSSVGCFHETVCIENDGYTIVTNRSTWISRWDKLYKKVEDTIQGIETVESSDSIVDLPVQKPSYSVVYVATINNLSRLSELGNYKTLTIVSPANMGLTEFEKLLLENYGHFCNWNASDIKRIVVMSSSLSLDKTRPVQKPLKKQSVVCTIAAKLAKQGIKNPMRVAWELYRSTITCLDALANKRLQHFFSVGFYIEYTLITLGVLPSQVLPTSVLKVFAKTGLVFA